MQKSQKLFTVKVNFPTYIAIKELKLAIEKRNRRSISIVALMESILGKYLTEEKPEHGKEEIKPEEE